MTTQEQNNNLIPKKGGFQRDEHLNLQMAPVQGGCCGTSAEDGSAGCCGEPASHTGQSPETSREQGCCGEPSSQTASPPTTQQRCC